MSSADSWRRELKNEKRAFMRQGYSDIKSKLKFRTCSRQGCNNTITGGVTCRPCLEGGPWARHVRRQSQLCPTCKNGAIITYGRQCPSCTMKVAVARKKNLQEAGTLEMVKEMLKAPPKMKAAPTGFDNSQYSIERKMLKHRMSLTMPNYNVRRV